MLPTRHTPNIRGHQAAERIGTAGGVPCNRQSTETMRPCWTQLVGIVLENKGACPDAPPTKVTSRSPHLRMSMRRFKSP